MRGGLESPFLSCSSLMRCTAIIPEDDKPLRGGRLNWRIFFGVRIYAFRFSPLALSLVGISGDGLSAASASISLTFRLSNIKEAFASAVAFLTWMNGDAFSMGIGVMHFLMNLIKSSGWK